MILLHCIILILVSATECELPQDCNKYCRIEYAGTRNYYNSTNGICYPITSCASNQVYIFNSNSCVSNSIPDLPDPPLNTTNDVIFSSKPLECINGVLQSGICICNEGYTTSPTQDINSPTLKYCEISTSDLADFNPYTLNNDGSLSMEPLNSSKIPLSFIERVSILGGIGIVLCIISQCIVHKMKKKYQLK